MQGRRLLYQLVGSSKMMKTTTALLGLVIFAACSKNISFPATYAEKHDENVASFESERYIFKTANDFEYIFFTDAINYSKYGHGKYYVKNSKLILEFSNQPFDTLCSKIESRPVPLIDSSHIRYKIHVQSYSGENLELMNVRLLHVKNKKIEASAFTDSSGYAEMSIVKSRIPVTLRAINLGYDYLTYEITTDESHTSS